MLQYTIQIYMFKSACENTKKIVYLRRQVLHDQLLQNPPGWEHSKGMRL